MSLHCIIFHEVDFFVSVFIFSSATFEVLVRLPKYAIAIRKRAQRPQEVQDPVRSEHCPQIARDVIESIPVHTFIDFVEGLSASDQVYLRHSNSSN